MDKSYQCTCFPKPQFAQAAGENSTEAALSGTQRMRNTGRFSRSFMDVRNDVVFTRCVLPLPLAFGIGTKGGSNVQTHTLEVVS